MACKTKSLLLALCVAALLAARSESHGLGDFTSGEATTTPEMQTFFKPQAAAALPEALDASMPAKPEATALPAAVAATTAAATTGGTAPSATPRRPVSVAAGVAAMAGIADRPDTVAYCEEDGDGWRKNGDGCVRSQGLVNGLLNGPQRLGRKV
jgi:hypothetical protein